MVDPTARGDCPSDEWLVAFLTGGLNVAERQQVDRHLQRCDQCVESLMIAHRRLRIASEVPAPIPAGVRQRTEPAPTGRTAPSPPAVRRPAGVSRLLGWLASGRRLPVLVPIAVAAGALLVIATQQTWEPRPRDRTRALPMSQTLRVTATAAAVRRQPTLRADVLATLHRGAAVEIRGEERDWYRIALPGGAEGWVDRSAFE